MHSLAWGYKMLLQVLVLGALLLLGVSCNKGFCCWLRGERSKYFWSILIVMTRNELNSDAQTAV